MHWYWSNALFTIKSCSCMILMVLAVSCASNFEKPERNIIIHFNNLEYLETTDNGMEFAVNGRLTNPNEFSIRPLRFTYQISLDGQHFEKGLINIRGKDEKIGLFLNVRKLRDIEVPLNIEKINAKLLYKSNSIFRFTFRIPFAKIGGFAAAMEREFLPYGINLIFTDERGKRVMHAEEGNIRLSAILHPIEFKKLVITSKGSTSRTSFGLHNANDFPVTVKSCSYELITAQGTINNRMLDDRIYLGARSWEFINLEEKVLLPTGSHYRFNGGCLLNDLRFSNSLSGVVQ